MAILIAMGILIGLLILAQLYRKYNSPSKKTRKTVPYSPPQSKSWSEVEKEVIAEHNQVRQDPKSYIPLMENWLEQMDQKGQVLINSNTYLTTTEGRKAVREAIMFLSKQPPLPPLEWSNGLARAAKDHAQSQRRGKTGHRGPDGSQPIERGQRYGEPKGYAENIAYGEITAQRIVMALIIDDGVPKRGHRTNIFYPELRYAGAGCGEHNYYGSVCVINYAFDYNPKT